MVGYEVALQLDLNPRVMALQGQYPAGSIQSRFELVEELFVGVLGLAAADNVNGMHNLVVYDPWPYAFAYFNTSEGASTVSSPAIPPIHRQKPLGRPLSRRRSQSARSWTASRALPARGGQ
jgi:hypothetical protein